MKIFCPCDKSFSIEHNYTINLDKNPEILTKIEDGSFLTFTCPKCKRPVRTELKTRIEWPSKNLVLLFVPEANRIGCLSSCSKINKKATTEFPIKKDETPVIGFSELAERIKIMQEDLNPHAMEILKFFVLDSGKGIKNKKIKIIFNKHDKDKLEFYVHGLKPNEVAIMNVPFTLYEKISTDLKKKKKQEVFTAVFLGNYLSYQNIFTEGQVE